MTMSQQARLAQMLSGYWTSQCLYVAAKLELPDQLFDGPKTAEQLAHAAGVHAPSLYRLLRALASLGVFAEDEQHRFRLTPLAEPLRKNVPGSQWAWAVMMGDEHYACWGRLFDTVRTGELAFDKLYGSPVFDYLSQHPDKAAIFDEAMVSIHGPETAAMLDAYDFAGIRTLADVGGGNGSLLTVVLKRHPRLNGLLYDLPGVIERARQNLGAAGVADRCQTAAGNFFESVPAGADAYLMRHIIHDWTDEQCQTILRNIRQVIPRDGRLLVVEFVIPPGNEPFFGKLLDLNMMLIPGGKERTEAEYRDLFASAGFRLTRIMPTRTEISIVEGQPV